MLIQCPAQRRRATSTTTSQPQAESVVPSGEIREQHHNHRQHPALRQVQPCQRDRKEQRAAQRPCCGLRWPAQRTAPRLRPRENCREAFIDQQLVTSARNAVIANGASTEAHTSNLRLRDAEVSSRQDRCKSTGTAAKRLEAATQSSGHPRAAFRAATTHADIGIRAEWKQIGFPGSPCPRCKRSTPRLREGFARRANSSSPRRVACAPWRGREPTTRPAKSQQWNIRRSHSKTDDALCFSFGLGHGNCSSISPI